jgi:S1-C subfamily serine protease
VALVTLENGREKPVSVVPRLLGDLQGTDHDFEQWGFTATAITTQMAIDERLTDTLGVYVLQAASPGPAYNGGLRRGDVIKKVDNRPVKDLQGLINFYDSLKDNEKLLLTVDRRGSIRLVLLKVDLTDESNERNIQPNE